MVNINFVPDDYVQTTESKRTNLLYIVLLVVVMGALGGAFLTIRMRQSTLAAEEQTVGLKLQKAQQDIQQFEQLQQKRKTMMKTALTTAELLEAMPKSVLLAALTNNLPAGTSLLQLNIIQKENKTTPTSQPTTKYQQAQQGNAPQDASLTLYPEKNIETQIDIEGIAPSDRQVATYIESLSASSLLTGVALVESKEYQAEGAVVRRFKLKAMLQKDIQLTKADIEKIRAKSEGRARVF